MVRASDACVTCNSAPSLHNPLQLSPLSSQSFTTPPFPPVTDPDAAALPQQQQQRQRARHRRTCTFHAESLVQKNYHEPYLSYKWTRAKRRGAGLSAQHPSHPLHRQQAARQCSWRVQAARVLPQPDAGAPSKRSQSPARPQRLLLHRNGCRRQQCCHNSSSSSRQ